MHLTRIHGVKRMAAPSRYPFLRTLLVFAGFIPAALYTSSEQPTELRASCGDLHGERPPDFRVAKEFRGDVRPALFLYISVVPSAISRDGLIALACKLGMDHAGEERVFVWILDNHRAAKRFDHVKGGPDLETNLAFRARYSFSRDPKAGYGQSLTWRPDRNDFNRLEKINLGPPPPLPRGVLPSGDRRDH